MAVAVITFFPAGAPTPLSDDALTQALETARALVPPGSRVEARALDERFLEMAFAGPDAAPTVKRAGDGLAPPIAGGAVTVWLDDGLDNLELEARRTMGRLHEALKGAGSGTFDARRHLDLVGSGPAPAVQAVNLIHRRASLDRDAFIQYYRTHHAPLAKRLEPRFVRYTTFRLLEALGGFSADAVCLQEFPSDEALQAHFAMRVRQGDEAHSDVGNFVDELVYFIGRRTFTQDSQSNAE